MTINDNNFLANLESFPTLPTVYTTILEKIQDPKTTVKDLASILILDQSSTLKLLSIVNSSMFSIRSKVSSISQAISLLGFNEVRDTLLTLSVLTFFKHVKSNRGFNIVELWKHSIAVGVISKLISKNLNLKSSDQFFIAGILHDIGKLLLIQVFGDQYINVLNEVSLKKVNLNKLEIEKFGIDHTDAGVLIAQKWNMPDSLLDCIQYHHRLDFKNPNIELIACVYLGNLLASGMQLGSSGTFLIEKPNAKVFEILNIKEGFIKSQFSEIITSYNESLAILKL